MVNTEHGDMVHDAQLDYYGLRLATCSSDKTVKIFEVSQDGNHKLEATLEGHEGPVWRVAWSHPSRHGKPLLASASHDGCVIVWMEESRGMWRRFYDYSWHASSVNSVAFAPAEYGLIFACASSDGFVSICTLLSDGTWDEQRVSESRDGAAHTHSLGANAVSWAPAISPGALWMPERAAPPPKRLVTAGCDHIVKVWRCNDERSWVLDGSPLRAHRELVRDVAWAPSIGLPRSLIASAGQDKRVVVWSREDEDSGDWVKVELPLFTSPVWSVSWSPAGNILGVACGDDSVSLWKEEVDGSWRQVTEISEEGAAPPEKS